MSKEGSTLKMEGEKRWVAVKWPLIIRTNTGNEMNTNKKQQKKKEKPKK